MPASPEREKSLIGGFLHPEASILGAILIVVSGILLLVAKSFDSPVLFYIAIGLGILAVILSTWDVMLFRALRRQRRRRNDKP